MEGDWQAAFLKQAQSDFAIYELLQSQDVAVCHQLHYLQMLTEKLSKGLTQQTGFPPTKHKAFVDFLRIAKGRSDIQRLTGIRKKDRHQAFMNSMISTADQIESLAPKGGEEGLKHVNPEYPWEQGGVVITPAEYAYTHLQLDSPKLIKLLSFVRLLLLNYLHFLPATQTT
jgi:hypothetical protein